MTEWQLSKIVKDYLKLKKLYAIKYHGNQFSKNGVPDWHVTIYGRSVWFELKVNKNKCTPLQIENLYKIREHPSLGISFEGRENTIEILEWLMKGINEGFSNQKLNAALPLPARRNYEVD